MRAERLTQVVRQYDKSLYVKRNPVAERLEVWRQDIPRDLFGLALSRRDSDQMVLTITDDWTIKGSPVDWGIEPILWKLKSMDSWRDDSYFDKMVKDRDKVDELKQRRMRNEIRAGAADIRKEIAKATNDIIVQK